MNRRLLGLALPLAALLGATEAGAQGASNPECLMSSVCGRPLVGLPDGTYPSTWPAYDGEHAAPAGDDADHDGVSVWADNCSFVTNSAQSAYSGDAEHPFRTKPNTWSRLTTLVVVTWSASSRWSRRCSSESTPRAG
jgi:hypothetical protein